MNLPNYFLADLPPEATVSPAMLAEACQTLQRNRERYLLGRTTRQMAGLLSGVARSWLQPDNPFRKLALKQGPAALGFSSGTLARGLDNFFKQVTPQQLQTLLEQDLGHAERLDAFIPNTAEPAAGRASIATAPALLVCLAEGASPRPSLTNMVLGVLLRSAQFVHCRPGNSLLPRLFAHSLYEAEPKLGACLELVEWPRERADLELPLLEAADCVVATGSDGALAELGGGLAPTTRFVAHPQRVSFGYLAGEVLTGLNGRKLAAQAAADIAAWNQLDSLAPHILYVQEGAALAPELFAELVAEELGRLEEHEPRGKVSAETEKEIAARRALYEVRAAHAPDTRQWCSAGSTAWTVVYEAEPRFQLSCLHRFVYVKPAKDLQDALQHADSVRGKVSTVGLAAPEYALQEMAAALARWGASRVCPLGQMQAPPLAWRQDGKPPLGELIAWTDWEMSPPGPGHHPTGE